MECKVKHKRGKYKIIHVERDGRQWNFSSPFDLAQKMGVNVTQIYAAIRTGKPLLTYTITGEVNIPELD